jgi:uncharacterized small protein (DUF1192 family)
MQCQKVKPDGCRCGARSLTGKKYCALHSEPGRAASLGSKGGRRRTVFSPGNLREFQAPKSAADLRDLLAESIIEIRTGRMESKMANALGYLGSSYLRALEVADLESRIEKLALEIERAKQTTASDASRSSTADSEMTHTNIYSRIPSLKAAMPPAAMDPSPRSVTDGAADDDGNPLGCPAERRSERQEGTNATPFPMRTLERSIRDVHDNAESEEGCICFPPDEPPNLALKAEIEAAKAVRCPIHGDRFSQLAPMIYVAAQFRQPTHLHPERWKWRSPQYVKAMEASFPPDRWSAQEIVDSDGGLRLLLKDRTVIHRISPPPVVYDIDTGEPCGRIGRNGRILPLPQPMAEARAKDKTQRQDPQPSISSSMRTIRGQRDECVGSTDARAVDPY